MNDDTLYGWIEPGPQQAVPGRDDVQVLEQPARCRLGRRQRPDPHGCERRGHGHRNGDLPRQERVHVVRRASALRSRQPEGERPATCRDSSPDAHNYDVVVPDGHDRRAARERHRTRPAPSRSPRRRRCLASRRSPRPGRTGSSRPTTSTSRAPVRRRVRRPGARIALALGARGARRLEPVGQPGLAHDHAEDRRPHHDDEHGAERPAPARARRLDADDRSSRSTIARTRPPSRAASSPTRTTTTTSSSTSRRRRRRASSSTRPLEDTLNGVPGRLRR